MEIAYVLMVLIVGNGKTTVMSTEKFETVKQCEDTINVVIKDFGEYGVFNSNGVNIERSHCLVVTK